MHLGHVMSTVACCWCGNYVTASNLRWPGYCSSPCRNADRADRQAERDRRRQARADARDRADADQRWRDR